VGTLAISQTLHVPVCCGKWASIGCLLRIEIFVIFKCIVEGIIGRMHILSIKILRNAIQKQGYFRLDSDEG
jgi:hypothetical protein